MTKLALMSGSLAAASGRKANLYLLSGESVEVDLDTFENAKELSSKAAQQLDMLASSLRLILEDGAILSDDTPVAEIPSMCNITVVRNDDLWWYPWGKYVFEGKNVLRLQTHTWYYGGGFFSEGEQERESAEVVFTDGTSLKGDEDFYKKVGKLARTWDFNKHLTEERTFLCSQANDSDCRYEYTPAEDPDDWEEYETMQREHLRGERRKQCSFR